ncbi:hypothetical protein AB0O91_00020 [Kitasatospora sp. NPDC089797]|uniref:hypothetical protein n=1 Tax=Kitasatospora sp. NPDC089797 TaxID=3155298 RepID=UPI00344970F0
MAEVPAAHQNVDPYGYAGAALTAHAEGLRREVADWFHRTRPHCGAPVLDPGYGRGAPHLTVEQRVGAVMAATGLPLALLDSDTAPLRITAISGAVEGTNRFTGIEAVYADGLRVTQRLPEPVEPADTDAVAQAAAQCGLFTGGVLVIDGIRCEATVLHAAPGGPVRMRMAQAGGWRVGVRGQSSDGIAVRLADPGRLAAPGRPNPTGAA